MCHRGGTNKVTSGGGDTGVALVHQKNLWCGGRCENQHGEDCMGPGGNLGRCLEYAMSTMEATSAHLGVCAYISRLRVSPRESGRVAEWIRWGSKVRGVMVSSVSPSPQYWVAGREGRLLIELVFGRAPRMGLGMRTVGYNLPWAVCSSRGFCWW